MADELDFLNEYDPSGADPLETPAKPAAEPDYLGVIANRFNRGTEGVKNSYFATWMMNQDMSDDEEISLLKAGAQKAFSEEDETAYKASPFYIRATSDAAMMLPGMGASIGTGVASGTGAAILGRGLIGTAAARAPIVGPLVTGLTFNSGFTAGNMSSIWTQSAGELYQDLRLSGVNKMTAKSLAYTFGSFNAGLEFLSLNTLAKFGGNVLNAGMRQQIADNIATPFVKKLEKNMMMRLGVDYLESVVVESSTEGAQTLSSELSKAIAGLIEKQQADAFTNWDTALENTKEAFMTALGASLVLGAGTGVGSYTLGKAVEGTKKKALDNPQLVELLNKLKDVTPGEIAARVNEALDEQPYPFEGEDADKQQVHVTEDGRVVITAGVTADGQAPSDSGQEGAGGTEPTSGIGSPEGTAATGPASSETVTEVSPAAKPAEEAKQSDSLTENPDGSQEQLEGQTEIEQALEDLFGTDEQDQMAPATVEGRVVGPVELSNELTPEETQARQNQVAADLRILNKEQKRLEAEFNLKDKTGKATNNVLAKIEAILTAKEQLLLEKELLDSGLMTREEVALNSGKQRMSTLAKILNRIKNSASKLIQQKQKYEDRLLEQQANFDWELANEKMRSDWMAAKAQHEGEKKGRSAERRAIRQLQTQLLQVIQAATNDRNIRAKLKSIVNKVTTQEQFDKAVDKIQVQLQKELKRQQNKQTKASKDKLMGKIERLIKRGRVRMENGRPVVRSLDADTVAKLQKFKNFVNDQIAAGSTITNFVQTYGTQLSASQLQNIPAEALENYQIAVMAYELNNKSVADLDNVATALQQWVTDGKSVIEEKRQAIQQKREDEKDTAEKSIGADTHVPIEGRASVQEAGGQLAESTLAGIFTFNNLMEMISPNDPDHAIASLLDPTEAKRNYHQAKETVQIGLLQKLQQALQNIGSKLNLQDKISRDSEEIYQFRYRDQNGNMKQAKYTKADLIDIWMKLQDDELHETMRDTKDGNGWTLTGDTTQGESFQELVESVLTPEDLAVGQALLDFYEEYHPRVNAKYRDKYGVDLPLRKNYSPLTREGFRVDPVSLEDDGRLIGSLLPGAAKSRTDNKFQVIAQNAYALAQEHVEQWEHFVAFDDLISTFRNVFSNPKIIKTIKDRHGDFTMKVIRDYGSRFIQNDPMRSDSGNWFWNAMRGNVSRAMLGFKALYQMATQFTSGIAMWRDYSVPEIIRGMGQYVLNAGKTETEFRNSPILNYRFKSGSSFELSQAVNQRGVIDASVAKLFNIEQPNLTVQQHSILMNLMFAGVRYGDAGVTRAFGGPLYYAEIARGKTPEQAMMAVERAVETTQQSDQVDQIPYMYANNQVLYAMFGLFGLQPLQLLNHSLVSVRDWKAVASKTKNPVAQTKAFLDLGKDIAALWLIPGLLYGSMKVLPALVAPVSDNDDRDKEVLFDIFSQTILGPVNGLPIIGEIVEAIWFSSADLLFGVDMKYKARDAGVNRVAELIYKNPGDAFNAWNKLLKPADPFELPKLDHNDKSEKEAKAWGKSVRAAAPLLGVPQQPFMMPAALGKAVKEQDLLGALFALGGWSPGMVNQRYAKKKGEGELPAIESDDDEPVVFDFDQLFSEGITQAPQEEEEEEKDEEEDDIEKLFSEGLLNGTMEEVDE